MHKTCLCIHVKPRLEGADFISVNKPCKSSLETLAVSPLKMNRRILKRALGFVLQTFASNKHLVFYSIYDRCPSQHNKNRLSYYSSVSVLYIKAFGITGRSHLSFGAI